jgi:hypothetical protein
MEPGSIGFGIGRLEMRVRPNYLPTKRLSQKQTHGPTAGAEFFEINVKKP